MDKTGTITKGNFEVQKCVALGVSEDKVLRLAANCELASTHPIGHSIVTAAKEKDLELVRPERVEEISGKGIKDGVRNRNYIMWKQRIDGTVRSRLEQL